MLTSIKGIFRNGHVELEEDPGIIGESAVVVTFLKPQPLQSPKTEPTMITFGMLAQRGRRMSDENDFKLAEHTDTDWDDGAVA